MSLKFSRAIINSELPKGSVWDVKQNGGLDLLFEGLADNNQVVKDFLQNLESLRNPIDTQILDDLEREYGVSTNVVLSEAIRRQRLLAKKTDKSGNGTDWFIQNKLREAGFDVYVYRNDPPSNPSTILNESFISYFGGVDSFFGGGDAYFGATSGELIVNGLIYEREKIFTAQMGGADSFFGGDDDAFFGDYIDFRQELNKYEVPANPAYWPLIFFVGGVATYNLDGSIKTIAQAEINIKRRTELRSLIVKYKPLHTWCGLIVYYT